MYMVSPHYNFAPHFLLQMTCRVARFKGRTVYVKKLRFVGTRVHQSVTLIECRPYDFIYITFLVVSIASATPWVVLAPLVWPRLAESLATRPRHFLMHWLTDGHAAKK